MSMSQKSQVDHKDIFMLEKAKMECSQLIHMAAIQADVDFMIKRLSFDLQTQLVILESETIRKIQKNISSHTNEFLRYMAALERDARENFAGLSEDNLKKLFISFDEVIESHMSATKELSEGVVHDLRERLKMRKL